MLAHSSLVIVSRWLNVMLILLAGYAMLTLLGSIVSPGQMVAKWGRVYVNLLLVMIAVFLRRDFKMGPASMAFVGFAILYMLVGLYSSQPFTAVKYKGLYLVLVLSGIFTAQSIKSERELRIGMRMMVITGIFIASAMLLDMARNPAALSRIGRFEPWGIVATRVGAACGPIGIICAFCALYDKSKSWKILAYVVGGTLAVLIVYSGSRGGLFMAGIGCFIIALPVIKRPVLAATSAILVGLVTYAVLSVASNSESAERFTEFNFDSRAEKWALAADMFREKLFFGAGWVVETGKIESGSTANLHNIYNQVAVEMGLFGLGVFFLALLIVVARAILVINETRSTGKNAEVAFLPLGLITAVLAFGIVESGPLMGSTTTGILLAFSIGWIDRLHALNLQERYAFDDHGGAWDSWDDHDDGDWDPGGQDEHWDPAGDHGDQYEYDEYSSEDPRRDYENHEWAGAHHADGDHLDGD